GVQRLVGLADLRPPGCRVDEGRRDLPGAAHPGRIRRSDRGPGPADDRRTQGLTRPKETPTPDVGSRVEVVSRGADPQDVALALRDDRDAILDRWLQTVRRQPFHEARPDRAIADHIPSLLDAVTGLLERSAASGDDMLAPLDDAGVAGMARAHAKM